MMEEKLAKRNGGGGLSPYQTGVGTAITGPHHKRVVGGVSETLGSLFAELLGVVFAHDGEIDVSAVYP